MKNTRKSAEKMVGQFFFPRQDFHNRTPVPRSPKCGKSCGRFNRLHDLCHKIPPRRYWLLRSLKDPIVGTILGVEYIPRCKILSLAVVFCLVCPAFPMNVNIFAVLRSGSVAVPCPNRPSSSRKSTIVLLLWLLIGTRAVGRLQQSSACVRWDDGRRTAEASGSSEGVGRSLEFLAASNQSLVRIYEHSAASSGLAS